MSRFLSKEQSHLTPYTPGEQPKDMQYIKLNTNESPFPPSNKAIEYAEEAAKMLQLYPDPTCSTLAKEFADTVGVSPDEVLFGNGSDEILQYCFLGFCGRDQGAAFPDITYGFYRVFAELYHIPYKEIPLKDDLTIDIKDYFNIGKTVFIANPNAPTGIPLSLENIREILDNNKNSLIIIDEAYVDFGGESAIPLIKEYDNLLVVQTFSKSRSMAGARLGMAIGNAALISDLNMIKYSLNPYNINRMTMAAGIGTLKDGEYTRKNCQSIIEAREYFCTEIECLGFTYLPSKTNFVFAKHGKISGKTVYEELKKKGVLVRHFSSPRLDSYNRITIGTKDQMEATVSILKEIIEEQK